MPTVKTKVLTSTSAGQLGSTVWELSGGAGIIAFSVTSRGSDQYEIVVAQN